MIRTASEHAAWDCSLARRMANRKARPDYASAGAVSNARARTLGATGGWLPRATAGLCQVWFCRGDCFKQRLSKDPELELSLAHF